jgi:AraC-like DNA-binding protein
MKYLICENEDQLVHVSSGQLLSEDGFIHKRRNLDTFVILICTKGKLYIAQDDRRYVLEENQYIILLAGHEHFGYKESDDALSYYWCHFKIQNDKYNIIQNDELSLLFDIETEKHFSRYYVVPEHGDISTTGRVILIFRQLLDLARKDCYSDMLPNYALSFLVMEISQEFIESHFQRNKKELNPKIEKIIEWIRINYNRRITMGEISKIFSYNPDYLSTAFRKYAGIPLIKYINIVRITNAKKLLLDTAAGIKEIAWQTGFEDEKTFMKRFKQLEGVTPSTYRNAFNRVKFVK